MPPLPEPLVWLADSLKAFGRDDKALLDLPSGEMSLTFRIGVHLAGRTGSYSVDAEYRTLGVEGQLKTAPHNYAHEHIRPDLIVHRRGGETRADNILFVEVKRTGSPRSQHTDLKKAKHAVAALQYQYAAVVSLVDRGRFRPRWLVMRADGSLAEVLLDGYVDDA